MKRVFTILAITGLLLFGAAPKAIGPRFGKTVNPKRAKFGKKTPSKILTRRRRR